MTVNLVQWRAVIGIFNSRISGIFINKRYNIIINLISMFETLLLFYHDVGGVYVTIITLLFIFALLLCHGDVEINPGPKKLKKNSLSVCHWNLNSLSAHNFSKLTQLKAYISKYKHDFICLSETYLDSSIPDSLLEIDGYNLIRLDHPNDIKRGGVCIYFKEILPVRIINIPYLKEALLLEMNYNNKRVIVSVIYRSPSQNNSEFDSFLRSVERLLSDIKKIKPFLSVITGDFNARTLCWWSEDINTSEGMKLLSLTSANGVSQLINEPTHLQTSNSSCIDLIFTDQPKLSANSGVHASLHSNCHHQIIHSSFNLNISYPPPYQRLVWDYKKADSKSIRKALDSVNWERLFDQLDINAQVAAFNETILNVFRNYVPNKYITIDDKDPVWMNENIKTKIKEKNTFYQKYIENGRLESDFILLEKLITELNDLIFSVKTVL